MPALDAAPVLAPVADLPPPVSPAVPPPAVSPATARDAAAPTLPAATPTLQPAVAARPASPSTSGFDGGIGGIAAMHQTSMTPRRRRQPLWQRVVRTTLGLLLAAMLVAAGVFVVQGYVAERNARRLPDFAPVPADGTVTFEFVEMDDGEEYTGHGTLSGDGLHLALTFEGDGGGFRMLRAGGAVFIDYGGGWITWGNDLGVDGVLAVAPTGQLDDHLPPGARAAAEVISRDEVVRDGVTLDAYEIEIALGDWREADRAGYDEWVTVVFDDDELPSSDTVRLVVSTDRAGRVMGIQTADEATGERAEYWRTGTDEAPFVESEPLVYFDATSVEIVEPAGRRPATADEVAVYTAPAVAFANTTG